MEATLFIKGNHTNIYILYNNRGRSEVGDTLARDNKLYNGFQPWLEYIADNGFNGLTREQFDCWGEKKKKRELFCELKKDPFRIGCFRYPGNKLLLVSIFRKYQLSENGAYNRAIRDKRRFDENQKWRSENG